MKLQNLLLVGAGSMTLAGMAAGAPLAVTAGTMMLAATALRNTHVNPATCLTFDKKEQYCHYKNKCDFPVSATAGRGFNIVEGKGRSSCLRDKNGPIPPDRSDVTVKRNPKARDCVVVHENTKDQNTEPLTDIRNHCNKDVIVSIDEENKGNWGPIPFIVQKKATLNTSIKFKRFGEQDIQVNFDTQKNRELIKQIK